MQSVIERCAGLDVHQAAVMATFVSPMARAAEIIDGLERTNRRLRRFHHPLSRHEPLCV